MNLMHLKKNAWYLVASKEHIPWRNDSHFVSRRYFSCRAYVESSGKGKWFGVCGFFFTGSQKYRVIRNDFRGFNNCHLVLHMEPYVISFYGITSRIRFMFLPFPQVSRNWRYESEPPLKPSKADMLQFGTNSIIVLMFVESQRVQI